MPLGLRDLCTVVRVAADDERPSSSDLPLADPTFRSRLIKRVVVSLVRQWHDQINSTHTCDAEDIL